MLPHYFFNILELVCVKNTVNKFSYELLDKIKFILYYFLVDSEQEKVELDKELVFYKYYIELENYRHTEKSVVNFNVLGQIENIYIIPLIFEPLIGNAMKYTKRDGTGWVNIIFDVTCFPMLHFCCSNNYSFHTNNSNSSESGLKILKQRLELCYKDKYTFNINENEDFYEINISLLLS